MEQLTLPIDTAPRKVRQHGLQEFGSFPYVSFGKRKDGSWSPTYRVPAPQAWEFPELELSRTPNSITAVLFDMDRDPTDWLPDLWQAHLPRPNWITWRKENMHAHIAYTLAKPVLTGDGAKPTPQRWLARIAEYYQRKLRADAGYAALLTHNPIGKASNGRYRTDWERREPYTLAELSSYIPEGWRIPPAPQRSTVYGRNDALFREGMKWSGQPRNWGDWEGLTEHVKACNRAWFPQGFFLEGPLPEREVEGIIKSVLKYQQKQLASGQTQRNFSQIQAARGKKSGAARRYKTIDRDSEIWAAFAAGQTRTSIAQRHGITRQAVSKILKRSLPKKSQAVTVTEPKQDDGLPAKRGGGPCE